MPHVPVLADDLGLSENRLPHFIRRFRGQSFPKIVILEYLPHFQTHPDNKYQRCKFHYPSPIGIPTSAGYITSLP
jgi:hypothetical protein